MQQYNSLDTKYKRIDSAKKKKYLRIETLVHIMDRKNCQYINVIIYSFIYMIVVYH